MSRPVWTNSQLGGALSLILVTALWGSTFVAIKSAVSSTAPSVVIFGRFLVAALVFLPWLPRRKDIWLAGLELGFWLGVGYGAQTIGLQYTTASQSAFITVLNVIFVPFLLTLAGHRVHPPVWVAAVLAVVGVGLLTTGGVALPNIGDAWTLLCAITYAVYVIRLGEFATRYPVLPLTATQLLGVVLFGAGWLVVDRPVLGNLPWAVLVYLGLATTALTTWLQTLGQRRIGAPEAAVIYSLEPVWAAFFAFLILAEWLDPQQLAGAGLICIAVLASQWRLLRRWRGTRGAVTVPVSADSRGGDG